MRISNAIELIDLAIYSHHALIMTDFHIGYEEALNKQGILVPRFQFQEIMKRLEKIFERLKGKKIGTIVISGDLKHEFGTISDQEWRNTLRLLDYFSRHAKHIVLLKGNHDTILGPIAEKRNVTLADYFIISKDGGIAFIKEKNNNGKTTILRKPIGEITTMTEYSSYKNATKKENTIQKLITRGKSYLTQEKKNKLKKNGDKNILVAHGDKIPENEILAMAGTIIIGHEHPAISIKDGIRSETFKCYLIGKWKGKNLIAQPSFNLITEGTDVMKEEVLSPFLKGNVKSCRVIVVADKLYDFGLVKGLG